MIRPKLFKKLVGLKLLDKEFLTYIVQQYWWISQILIFKGSNRKAFEPIDYKYYTIQSFVRNPLWNLKYYYEMNSILLDEIILH